jgi:copper chaperone
MGDETLVYDVPDISCAHCRAAILVEVGRVAGDAGVEVDLEAKRVTVTGPGLDDAALRGAIADAGFDVGP